MAAELKVLLEKMPSIEVQQHLRGNEHQVPEKKRSEQSFIRQINDLQAENENLKLQMKAMQQKAVTRDLDSISAQQPFRPQFNSSVNSKFFF